MIHGFPLILFFFEICNNPWGFLDRYTLGMLDNTSWPTYGEPFAFHLPIRGRWFYYKHPDDSSKQNRKIPLGTYDYVTARERSFEIYDNLLQSQQRKNLNN